MNQDNSNITLPLEILPVPLPIPTPIDVYINTTCNSIITLMNMDYVQPAVQTSILAVVKLVLNSNMYIGGIKYQIHSIIADGKFDQNDIPALLTIIIQSKMFLQTAIGNGANVALTYNTSTLKYIIFGVIHYILIAENTNPLLVQNIDTTFSNLWNLVVIDPAQLALDTAVIASHCFPCCGRKLK